MNRRGDDGSEMPRQDPFDDAAFDRLLSGQSGTEMSDLASFVEDARTAAEAVPTISPALAAALATGILPVPAPVPQSLWRKSKMKIQGFLAGMSVAGKIALGVGVAAAATTGAGAAGVLPGPVQHAVASAVGTVTPFELPDGSNHDGGNVSEPPVDVTTTTSDHHEVTPTTEHHESPTTEKSDTTTTEPHDSTPTTERHETPTTESHDAPPTTTESHDGDHHETPTTEKQGDGDNHETPTTEHHDGDTTTTLPPHGDVNFTSFSCVYNGPSEPTITCTWTVDNPGDAFRVYVNGTQIWTTYDHSYSFSPDTPCGGTTYHIVDEYHDHVYATSESKTADGC
jgi:hypothetical protein